MTLKVRSEILPSVVLALKRHICENFLGLSLLLGRGLDDPKVPKQ